MQTKHIINRGAAGLLLLAASAVPAIALYSSDAGPAPVAETPEQSETLPVSPADYNRVVYFQKPDSWTKVNIWVWDSSANYTGGTWPGMKMYYDPASNLYYYTFKYSGSDEALQCIFSDNGGSPQTKDLSFANENVYDSDGGHVSPEEWLNQGNTLPTLPDPEEPDEPIDPDDPDEPDNPDNPDGPIYVLLDDGGTWSNTMAYIYDETHYSPVEENNAWPGVAMKRDVNSNYWFIKVPDNLANGQVIFSANEGRYPADKDPGLAINGKSHIYTLSSGNWAEYTGPTPSGSSSTGSYVGYTEENGEIIIETNNGYIHITPWAPQVVKVFSLMKNASAKEERQSISVVDKSNVSYEIPVAEYSITDTEDSLEIEIENGVTVSVAKADCHVSFSENGRTMLAESEGLYNAPNGGNSSVSFEGMGDKGFYGGGYGDTMNISGQSLLMDNYQSGGWPDQDHAKNHNICIPFYVSTNGYGVYFDDHYKGAQMYMSPNGSSFNSSSETPIAYYYVGGGSMESVMQNYTLLTGRQSLPPYWAMGYLTSKYSFRNTEEATYAITRTRELRLPLDAIVFDIHWQGTDWEAGSGNGKAWGMGTLDWDKSAFPNGDKLVQDFLKDYNVHSVAITEPFFNSQGTAANNYNHLAGKGWLADDNVGDMSWVGDKVGLIDASNPEAMNWFADQYVGHTRNGMAGWWLDLGEPEKHDNDGSTRHAGGSFNQIHNEYGNLWIEGVYNKLRSEFPEMRQFLLPRAGTAGMQRFSTFPWTGDIMRSWDGLKVQIPSVVNGSMSGIGYLGSDIGGFRPGGTNEELYVRWVQLGVFYPMMRTHSGTAPEPYNYMNQISNIRKFIRMRYSYLPYTYTLAYNYTRYGTPLARPLSFLDPSLASVGDEYLWGPDILVAPVVTSGTSRSISFPQGKWIDLNNGQEYKGTVTYSAGLDVLPHFLRQGAMVPRYTDNGFTYTGDMNLDDVEIEFFPFENSDNMSGELYEDDRTTPDPISTGDFHLTKFSATANNGGLAISISHEGNTHYGTEGRERKYTFHIYGFNPGEDGVVAMPYADGDGRTRSYSEPTTLSAHDSKEAFDNSSEDGYYTENSITHVRVSHDPLQGVFLRLGSDDVVTGLKTVDEISGLWLAYGNGTMSYSASADAQELTLVVYSVTGALVGEYTGLTADDTVHQLDLNLPGGVYVARLSGRNSDKAFRSETLKMVVK